MVLFGNDSANVFVFEGRSMIGGTFSFATHPSDGSCVRPFLPDGFLRLLLVGLAHNVDLKVSWCGRTPTTHVHPSWNEWIPVKQIRMNHREGRYIMMPSSDKRPFHQRFDCGCAIERCVSFQHHGMSCFRVNFQKITNLLNGQQQTVWCDQRQ